MSNLDKLDHGVSRKERLERFAGVFVQSRNEGRAFRTAFVVDPLATVTWVNAEAEKLLSDPYVKQRIQELWDAAAVATMISARDLVRDWVDIATADPNELVSHVIDCCRFCHGVDHHYQWKDDTEYTEACERASNEKRPLPDFSGGFGFNPLLDPSVTCPACFGRGNGHIVAHDTRKLSARAAKLYKGAKETKNGLEILMHDQEAARANLAKVLGAFKADQPLSVGSANPSQETIATAATDEQAAKSYMRLIQGGKA